MADPSLKPINVFDYQALAEQRLSPMARDYYNSGAWDEVTLQANRQAFARLQLRPRVLVDVSQRELATQVLGQGLQCPILVAPMAFQCLAHPEGELATARAATALGVGMVLSTLSTRSLEEVSAIPSCSPRWFQLYIHRDRGLTQCLVERAYAAGYQAICLTVDAPVLGRRECDARNQFALPAGLRLANLSALTGPGIVAKSDESGLFAYFTEQVDPSVTWKDLAWLQSLSPLPLVVKGILRGDDARRAVDQGVKAIIVSNHGGRQLDGAIATLDALPEVAAAVGQAAEVLVDGGIRRGTDVLKALTLGAGAVLVGRPVLWGLAVAGEAGAEHVLTLLRDELDLAMALSGCARLADVTAGLVKEIKDPDLANGMRSD